MDCVGAAGEFFCGPGRPGGGDVPESVTDSSEECVFREDTLVLLEMTTRDMMEVRPVSRAAVFTKVLGFLPVPGYHEDVQGQL